MSISVQAKKHIYIKEKIGRVYDSEHYLKNELVLVTWGRNIVVLENAFLDT